MDLYDAYKAGVSCGLNGPNKKNSQFRFFRSAALMLEWERGRVRGEKEKFNQEKLAELKRQSQI